MQLYRSANDSADHQAQLATDTVKFHAALTELVRACQFRDRDRICCLDLSVNGYYALDALITQGPLSLKALAAHLRLEKSSASRLVAGLEQRGYVSREADENDGRAIRLAITDPGRMQYTRIAESLMMEYASMLAPLSPAVRQAAVVLIQQLAAGTTARAAAGSFGPCSVIDALSGPTGGGTMRRRDG